MAGTVNRSARADARNDSDELWRELSRRLRAFVRKRVTDPDDVEDIVQEVFLRIHRSLPDLRDTDRLLGWIFQIARNAIIDHYRAAPRRRELLTESLPDAPGESHDEGDDTARLRQELAACLQPALNRLAPRYRQALELTELGDFTQAAAARELGLSVSGMKSRVQRGRHQLLDVLHEWCHFSLDARGVPIHCSPRCLDG